jgi:uncharacterized protein
MSTALQAGTAAVHRQPTGIGLRFAMLAELVATPVVQGLLLEIHTENLFSLAPHLHAQLASLRAQHAFSLHGVGLSLGSADELDEAHLRKVAEQVRRYEPMLVSEHLAWNRVDGVSLPDLLPVPYTHAALQTLVRHVNQTQEALRRPIALENISAYLNPTANDWHEADFLTELAQRTGCTLLVDVNNLHVNELNHGTSPTEFLKKLKPQHISQWHLGGPSEVAGAWVDTHASTVPEPVWALYERALQTSGPRPTIVEWDQDLPPLAQLLALARRAAVLQAQVGGQAGEHLSHE